MISESSKERIYGRQVAYKLYSLYYTVTELSYVNSSEVNKR